MRYGVATVSHARVRPPWGVARPSGWARARVLRRPQRVAGNARPELRSSASPKTNFHKQNNNSLIGPLDHRRQGSFSRSFTIVSRGIRASLAYLSNKVIGASRIPFS
jgi:hypothetical protein